MTDPGYGNEFSVLKPYGQLSYSLTILFLFLFLPFITNDIVEKRDDVYTRLFISEYFFFILIL